jgi:hypothetical protein
MLCKSDPLRGDKNNMKFSVESDYLNTKLIVVQHVSAVVGRFWCLQFRGSIPGTGGFIPILYLPSSFISVHARSGLGFTTGILQFSEPRFP